MKHDKGLVTQSRQRRSLALPKPFPLNGGITITSSVPHPIPSRMTHNVAALFGQRDDTLVAWQQACAHAADALSPQHDRERLAKALALAQNGAVALDDDGAALVTSGVTRYHVDVDGTCSCPDAQH